MLISGFAFWVVEVAGAKSPLQSPKFVRINPIATSTILRGTPQREDAPMAPIAFVAYFLTRLEYDG